MNVFGIGLPELAVIAAIGLLVFGPKRLPELGKTLGRTIRGFQSASQEFEQEFRTAIAPLEEATRPGALSPGTGGPVQARAMAPEASEDPSEVPVADGVPASVPVVDQA